MSEAVILSPHRARHDDARAPLVVDLVRLLRTNLNLELFLAALRIDPRGALWFLWWLRNGSCFAISRLAQRTGIDVKTLPVRHELIHRVASEADSGRKVLVTAPHDALAGSFAARFSFISGVSAAPSDAADEYIILTETRPLSKWIGALWRGLRPHQWAKNILVFVPVVLSGRVLTEGALWSSLVAFAGLCLLASGTYLANDLWDLADDRKHWSKRNRPLASGSLSLGHGLMAAPLLIATGLVLASSVGIATLEFVLIYLAMTLSYSFYAKRVPLLDVLVLATLFTLRLAIGTAASGAPPSAWLFVFSMFLFCSLSFAKRQTEMTRMLARGSTSISGRGYTAADTEMLRISGLSLGIAAIVIFVLYIINDAFPNEFYGNPLWLWTLPCLLFLFIGRIWLIEQRGQLLDDPVAFAVSDRPCLLLGGLMIAAFLFAWAGVPISGSGHFL